MWRGALDAERQRSELLLARLEEEEAGGGSAGGALEEEAGAVRALLEEGAAGGGEAEFQRLRACNDGLQQALDRPRGAAARPSGALGATGRLDGIGVVVETLPPVDRSDEFALVAGAPHVRVSLPLGLDGLMWGSDLTPFFDAEGARLMVFLVSLPLGMRIAEAPRPSQAPVGPGGALVVEAVSPSSEAERNGIQAGDYLRAVSYMGPGEEPGFIDKMLGATAIPLPKVMKCDGLSVDDVTAAMATNSETPDGTFTLMLERPPAEG